MKTYRHDSSNPKIYISNVNYTYTEEGILVHKEDLKKRAIQEPKNRHKNETSYP
jgi:hypothetical protein